MVSVWKSWGVYPKSRVGEMLEFDNICTWRSRQSSIALLTHSKKKKKKKRKKSAFSAFCLATYFALKTNLFGGTISCTGVKSKNTSRVFHLREKQVVTRNVAGLKFHNT